MSAGRFIVWILAILTSLAGVWLSYQLVLVHLKVPKELRVQLSKDMCSATAQSSCEEVAESPWGRFPFGAPKGAWAIPTATLGLIFFVSVLGWMVLIGPVSPSRWWIHLILLSVVGFGLGFSAYLDYIMWARLPKWCPMCLGLHIANLLLFIFGILLWPRQPKPAIQPGALTSAEPQSERESLFASAAGLPSGVDDAAGAWPPLRMLVITPLIIVLLLVGANGMVAGTSERLKSKQMEEFSTSVLKKYDHFRNQPQQVRLAWQLTRRVDIPVEKRPARGPADARHTVVIFSDFECPGCKKYEDFFNSKVVPLSRKPEFGGMKVIFKHWPICSDCNRYATRNLHPLACEAAYAAEAAYAVGGDAAFWLMHDLLFARQEEWKKTKDFARLAGLIGLDVKAFNEAMKSEPVRSRVKADIEEGATLGTDLLREGKLKEGDRDFIKVDGTPAIFVDGKRLYVLNEDLKTWELMLTGVPTTAPAELATRISDLEKKLKVEQDKLKEAGEAFSKAHQKAIGRYENRPEHAYLGWQLSPAVNIPIEGRPARGQADAKHTVVLFSDFECPSCKKFEQWLGGWLFKVGAMPGVGGVRMVFKQWPICVDCNPAVKKEHNLHPDACKAAYAAEAAYMLGGDQAFWRMHDLLFAKQEEWKKTLDFVSLARELGLDEKAFTDAMNSDAVKARVKADVEDGIKLGKELVEQKVITEDQRDYVKVESTPTIYVDFKRLHVVNYTAVWNQILGYVPRKRPTGPVGPTVQPGATPARPPATAPAGLPTTAPG